MKNVIIIAKICEDDLIESEGTLKDIIHNDIYMNTDAVYPGIVIFEEEVEPNDQKLGEQIRKHL